MILVLFENGEDAGGGGVARRPGADGGTGDLETIAVDVSDLVVDADDEVERSGGAALGKPLKFAGGEPPLLREGGFFLLVFLEELRLGEVSG